MPGSSNRHARILWWGNVRGLDFDARVGFAARHGFDAMNISPADIVGLLDGGRSLTSLKATARDAGVALTYLDPVVSWLPDWRPGPEAAEFVPFLEAGVGREFEFAVELGIDRMLTITAFPFGRYGIDELAEHLGLFAQRADDHGITCVLEAMPMWGLPNFADVVELMRKVDAPNVRLLFDTWHYLRGDRADNLISELPPGVIDHVQIADGQAQPTAGLTLFHDCLFHRLPPGEGALPLGPLLQRLAQAGHLTSVGPEVFSKEFDGLDAQEIAARLMPAFDRAITQAEQDAAVRRVL